MTSFTHLRLIGWGARHRPQLASASAVTVVRFATSVAYEVLPIVIAVSYGSWKSGAIIAAFSATSAFLGDPLAGNLSDRIGAKRTIIMGCLLLAGAGLLWLLVPLSHPLALAAFGLLLFFGYSLRDEISVYLLRMSGQHEGGLVFGVAENLFAVATFLATLCLPYFAVTGREPLAAALLLVLGAVGAAVLAFLPGDPHEERAQRGSTFSPLTTVRRGMHFIRMNGGYPLLSLGGSAFEGIFYGVLWFVIPVALLEEGGGTLAGLSLGIYEIVTILLAGYVGYLADRYDWRKIFMVGWALVGVGTVALAAGDGLAWLIGVGAAVAVGNNLFGFAASHALEEYDADHREDGAFAGIDAFVSDACYAIGPLVAGAVYYAWGFQATLAFAAGVSVVLAIGMIALAARLREPGPTLEAGTALVH